MELEEAISSFDLLSNDELWELALVYLELPELQNICLASSRFQALICDNELFWKQKFQRDLEEKHKLYPRLSWKHNYLRLMEPHGYNFFTKKYERMENPVLSKDAFGRKYILWDYGTEGHKITKFLTPREADIYRRLLPAENVGL